MNSKIYIIFAVAVLGQEIIREEVLADDAPSEDVPEEAAEYSDSAFYLAFGDLIVYLSEKIADVKTCYFKHNIGYKKLVKKYITELTKAGSELKGGVPKSQAKIIEKMTHYPQKLDKQMEGQNYEVAETFMWGVINEISQLDYEFPLEMKKLREKSSNKKDLEKFEKLVKKLRDELEREIQTITFKILECISITESNF